MVIKYQKMTNIYDLKGLVLKGFRKVSGKPYRLQEVGGGPGTFPLNQHIDLYFLNAGDAVGFWLGWQVESR